MKKIFSQNFYHIYLRDKCVYATLPPEIFEEKWRDLKAMIELMDTEFSEDDLTYEEVEVIQHECEDASY